MKKQYTTFLCLWKLVPGIYDDKSKTCFSTDHGGGCVLVTGFVLGALGATVRNSPGYNENYR